MDPEDIASESPYAAFRNNPIIFNDPDGNFPGGGGGGGGGITPVGRGNFGIPPPTWNWSVIATYDNGTYGFHYNHSTGRGTVFRSGTIIFNGFRAIGFSSYNQGTIGLPETSLEAQLYRPSVRINYNPTPLPSTSIFYVGPPAPRFLPQPVGGPIATSNTPFTNTRDLLLNPSSSNLWKVGPYGELQGLEQGLDAHHVGQKVLMRKFIPSYDKWTGPSILVPKLGHTQKIPGIGIVSRSTNGFMNSRQVLARDIFELRRVYGSQGIPNSALKKLIELNKSMYPNSFLKNK